MSKKFKNKTCVYCATAVSESADHVLAKGFFPPTHRDQLPKAPACPACNRTKSDLERQFTALLHFGSIHEASTTTLLQDGGRRLDKNPGLRRQLQEGQRRIVAVVDGQPASVLALPLDGEGLVRLSDYIVRGLVWHRWKHIVPREYVVEVVHVTDGGLQFFERLLQMSPSFRGGESFARDAFAYRCTRAPDDAAFSAWHLRFYGRLNLAAVGANSEAIPLHICALTGPPGVKGLVDQLRGIGTGSAT